MTIRERKIGKKGKGEDERGKDGGKGEKGEIEENSCGDAEVRFQSKDNLKPLDRDGRGGRVFDLPSREAMVGSKPSSP